MFRYSNKVRLIIPNPINDIITVVDIRTPDCVMVRISTLNPSAAIDIVVKNVEVAFSGVRA